MNTARLKCSNVIVLSIVLLALPGMATAQTAFNRIVVFGTSLSDPGNAFALTKMQNNPPYSDLDSLLIPSAPYAKGGHHFSNGATWIEQLARPLGFADDTRPAFGNDGITATNYAVGGARARTVAGGATLSAEVSAFLQDFGSSAPPDALYVIEFGGNDIRDALAAGDATIIYNALEEIGANITTLYYAGARKFFVWDAPDISLAPAVQMLGEPAITYANLFSQGFNIGLAGLLSGLSSLPGIEIVTFDIYGILNGFVSDPGAFDLSEVHAACIAPNDQPFECKHPDEYLFWDGIHPTKAVHAILAQDAAFLLTQ